MLDKNTLGLLNTQIEALKSVSGKEFNTAILETIKLLLSNVELSEELLKSYDKFEIRELFSAYSAVSEGASTFFDKHKGILDPKAMAGSLGSKLIETTESANQIRSSLKEMMEKESELLSEEAKYNDIKKEYDDLSQKVLNLKTTRDTMTPEILDKMKSDISKYEDEIKKNSKVRAKLEKELDEKTTEFKKIQNELETIAGNDATSGNEILKIIDKYVDTLRLLYEKNNLSIDVIISKIREYEHLYEKLDSVTKEQTIILAEYEAVLGENSLIVNSMKKYGVQSISDVIDDIERIKQTIASEIEAYNFILQKVINQEKSIKETIERRQGKNV